MSRKSLIAKYEALRRLAAASIAAESPNYVAIGDPLDHSARILHIFNLTDAQLIFSEDGTNDHIVLPSGGYITEDLVCNRTEPASTYEIPKGRTYYVKQEAGSAAPSNGDVFVMIRYGESNV